MASLRQLVKAYKEDLADGIQMGSILENRVFLAR